MYVTIKCCISTVCYFINVCRTDFEEFCCDILTNNCLLIKVTVIL